MRKPKQNQQKPKPERPVGRVAQVSELKAGLSAYLEHVKRGEQVIVTERGRSIAKLVPIPQSQDPEMERMRRLEREGRVIVHGTGRIPPEFWLYEPPADPEGLVLKALLEERREGR